MTRVKMLVGLSGTINRQPWPERQGEIEVEDSIAEDLIANGYAVRVASAKSTAAVDPVEEKAAKPVAKARKSTTKE